MSQVRTLRAFVNQRLTEAAEEIFQLFERTVAEYEEELRRQRQLLDAVLKPEVRLHRADVWPSGDPEPGGGAMTCSLQDHPLQEETINNLKYEKIDSSLIPLMPEQDLSKYTPHYEDRLAAALCPSPGSDPGTSRRNQLLDRMKSRVRASDGRGAKRAEKLKGNKNAKRKAKRVEIGWMNFSEKDNEFKQVRSVKGGGTRHVIVNRHTTVRKIQELAQSFFFPDGLCTSLKLQDHACSVRDFSQNEIEPDCTVEELYDRSKVKMLRLYLFTKRHAPGEDDSATSSGSPDFNRVRVSGPEVRTADSSPTQESDLMVVEVPNIRICGEERGTPPSVE